MQNQDENRAVEALRHWGLANARLEFLRHNENEVWKVMRGNEAFLLRIHQMTAGFSDSIFGRLDQEALRRSESHILLWLVADGRIPVQEPMPALDGSFVAILSDGTPATLLRWLRGETVASVPNDPSLWTQIGKMTALMRLVLQHLPQIPARRYDDALWGRMQEELSRIEGEFAPVFCAAAEEVRKRLKGSPLTLQHSDLGADNMILTDSGVAPIDFGLSGYAPAEMDIGSLLSQCNTPRYRAAALEGYRSVTEDFQWEKVQACYASQVLLFLAAQRERFPDWSDWICEAQKRWCEEIFLPLLDKREFIDLG